VLGQLSAIIEANQLHKTQKNRLDADKHPTEASQLPQKLSDIQINGSVSTDKFGSICLGTFQSIKPNLSIKTFLLDAKAAQMLSHEISNCKEVANIIESSSTPNSLHFIPLLLTSFRTSNGFHMIYDTAVIASLESLYQSDGSHLPLLPYVAANIINGLEFLHKIGVVYRSIQPETIHITSQGKVVLMDYSICKIGGVGRETFTLCGVPDYLSPEQVSQRGHNEAVDFWSLGVLLYELTTHTNPFSQDNSGELAIFSKITSYGTPTFPQITFPAIFPNTLSSLITELLNPSPMERLGVGSDGFSRLRQHKYFSSIKSFDSQSLVSRSPIQTLVKEMEEFILSESGGVTEIISQWNKEVAGTEYIDDILKED
jgi:serine/threonine protein kinase